MQFADAMGNLLSLLMHMRLGRTDSCFGIVLDNVQVPHLLLTTQKLV